MPLHTLLKKELRDRAAVDVYAVDFSTRALPKHRLPDASQPAAVAYDVVRDELLLDGNSRQNLATFCTT